jgi:Cof subfamily protein (haloacid dehalogenase superfamily)
MEKPLTEIKLIAIDIDGTLLNPAGEITARVRGAIEAAQRAGIIVTLATARRYFSTRQIADMLGLELPLIVYDGALIVNHPAQTILHSQPLSARVARQVIEIFLRHNVQPVVQPCDGLLEAVWTGPAERDQPELTTYIAAAGERLCRMSYEQLCAGSIDPLRVVAFASQDAIQRLIPEVSALACSWSRLSMGSYACAELAIMHSGCSKASGVAALAAFYGIPLAQVMAIGDNTNDIAMLQAVGWGVAMGQAPAVVKAAARAITASNQEDGVALAIERYALTQRPHVVSLQAAEMTAPLRSFPVLPDQADKALASD